MLYLKRFSYLFLLLLCASCDKLWEQEPDYSYYIQNNTTAPIQVVVEVKQNLGTVIVGDGKFYYTLAPGKAQHVWRSSGYTDSMVHDWEEKNQDLHAFRISSLAIGNVAVRNYLNGSERWLHEKKKNYSATYTLTVTDHDF